jgi:acyl-CoA thioesterase-2
VWAPVTEEQLLAAFDLEAVGEGRFVSRAAVETWPIIPGAQQLGASVVALERALPGLQLKALTLSFARGARPDEDAVIEVSTVHRGGSLATGRLTWTQGRGVHTTGMGLLVSPDLPDHVAYRPLADLPPDPDAAPDTVERDRIPHLPFDVFRVLPRRADPARPVQQTWLRWPSPPAESRLHRAMLCHLSELLPLGPVISAFEPVVRGQRTLTSVVWQSVTLHEPVDLGQWHLVVAETEQAGAGMSTARSRTYRSDGLLVATVEQTMVLRPIEHRPA